MENEASQQEAQPPRKILKRTVRIQRDSLDEDLESSNHEVDEDELEQEDEIDELQDDDEMRQSDKRDNVDQEESRDKVDEYDDDDGNGDDDEYLEDNLDSANKQPADPDDEVRLMTLTHSTDT